jgi:hypothetical protein
MLEPEAEVLAAEAALAVGDRPRAVSLARAFASEHPDSPLLPRLGELLR